MSDMNTSTKDEINISAVLDTYVYMDEQKDRYKGLKLDEILFEMPDDIKATDEYQAVLAAVRDNPELGELKLISQSMCEGFSEKLIIACTFQNPATGDIYIAYRGTGDGKWVDNGVAMACESSQMQEEALKYFDSVVEAFDLQNKECGKIFSTGHSKGGNEAQYITLASQYGYLIDNCYSIDGQGFSQKAIDKFKELYGEDYYENQLAKMYSINGENDYVHDLGIVVISKEKTFFIETPNAKDIGGYHNIIEMLNGAGVNWKYDGDTIISAEQGYVGEFAKVLSENMMKLDDEDLEDCAVTIMSLLEYFMPYDGEFGGEYKVGTGYREFATIEEFIGFVAYGIPVLLKTIATDEGMSLIENLMATGLDMVYDKIGGIGVFAVAVVSLLLLSQLYINTIITTMVALAAGTVTVAFVLDKIADFMDTVKEFPGKIKELFCEFKDMIIGSIGKTSKWENNNFNSVYRYTSTNSEIVVDTYKLRYYAWRLQNVNRRIAELDSRLDSLYWKEGFLDLWNLIQADMLTGYSYNIQQSIAYLNETANDFDTAEKAIINY